MGRAFGKLAHEMKCEYFVGQGRSPVGEGKPPFAEVAEPIATADELNPILAQDRDGLVVHACFPQIIER